MISPKLRPIKSVFDALHQRLNLIYFFFLLKRSNSNIIWIVDLDNTIANTWPLRKRKYNDERIFREVKAFEGTLKFLYNKINSGDLFIILSARPFKYQKTTKKWIKDRFRGKLNPRVFLVENPSNKLNFIKHAIEYNFKVTYIDDLSYNHENENVKFYYEVIDRVNKLPIKYIGYEEILKLQE